MVKLKPTTKKTNLESAADLIRQERRKYNKLLHESVTGKHQEYNTEDLMRLVGTLEAAYNHTLAAIAGSGDIYCILKHISYAIVLVGELDKPNLTKLYNILGIVSGGVIKPCLACQQDIEEVVDK